MAGGVPEVMLHLRGWGCCELDALTVSGEKLGTMLDWWERLGAPAALRQNLREQRRDRSGSRDYGSGGGASGAG